jgi:hypothetical protein
MTRETVILGKYRCEECNHNFHGTCDLRQHMNSKKHITKPKKVKTIYHCECCNHTTTVKRDIILHLKTPRHFKHLKKCLLVEIRNYKK